MSLPVPVKNLLKKVSLYDPLLRLRDSGRVTAQTARARIRFDATGRTIGVRSITELQQRFQLRGVTLSDSSDYGAGWVSGYKYRQVKNAMQELLQTIDPGNALFRHRKRVVVKVNMAGDFGAAVRALKQFHLLPGETYWTHPMCFQAFAELARDAGASEVVLVEALFDQPTYFHFGYHRVVKKLGLRFVDLNFPDPYPRFVEVSSGAAPLAHASFQLNPILVENDLFVSFAKLKQHHVSKISMTIKNLIGILPVRFHRVETRDNNRTKFHSHAQPEVYIANVMLDLMKARPIDLALIDGITTIAGSEGPWNKEFVPAAFHTLLCGKNAVAIDSLGTMVIDQASPKYLTLAENLGLGIADPAKLSLKLCPSPQ